MKVGWLADRPSYTGGAELTQQEFRDAAPEDVEIIDCPAGNVVRGLDLYVIHNCGSYVLAEVESLNAPLVRYVNDTWTYGDYALREYLLRKARLIFTSPLHRERFPHEVAFPYVHEIPPAVPLHRYRTSENGHRQGNVCVGRMAYGKGVEHLIDYPEPIDVYSTVALPSEGSLTFRGALSPSDVPEVLRRYKTFVFLPSALEPFGRAVVEAWASGLELVVNRNVGALYWIENEPEKLASAAVDFWEVVLQPQVLGTGRGK